MSAEPVILLLGRRDEPTDGVLDYCENLRQAGAARGFSFELAPVPWAERGWGDAVAELREKAAAWRNRWVLLQFTTLAWSRRGFPLRAPRILETLRRDGAKPAVVFHDFEPVRGAGIVGNAREYCHRRVLNELYAISDLAIFTVPVNLASWLPLRRGKAVFIPVGANCPEALPPPDGSRKASTVAVYSITGGNRISSEVADLGAALKRASHTVGEIRVLLFGRGSKEAEPALRAELIGTDVQIESLGLLPPDAVSRTLARADALLFVRGHISSRRGSAIAGIAASLPIVCYSGPETGWPITEAGILPVPLGDREALAASLERVLSDWSLRKELAERSREAQKKYFSWDAIFKRFDEELHLTAQQKERPSEALDNGIARRIESGSCLTK